MNLREREERWREKKETETGYHKVEAEEEGKKENERKGQGSE